MGLFIYWSDNNLIYHINKILKILPEKQHEQFVERIRRRGIEDSRKDQSKGLDNIEGD